MGARTTAAWRPPNAPLLDPNLAEGHAARARVLDREARHDEALAEIDIALRLDPDSYEVNAAAGRGYLMVRRYAEAIAGYEKAATLMETDYMSAGMLVSCYKAIGDQEGALRAARRSLARAERIIAHDPVNGSAMSFAVSALAALGETERAKEWAARATLLDPDNVNMRYNFACMLVLDLHDHDGALDLLDPLFQVAGIDAVKWSKSDVDLDAIRDHPRFKAMVAAAEARLAQSS
jgi:adenylate cyclase